MNIRNGEFSVGEFLGAILAVGGVILLFLLGMRLYSLFVDQDLKNAQTFIDDLVAKIGRLPNCVSNDPTTLLSPDATNVCSSNTFALRGVEGWVLAGWSRADTSTEGKPDKCFFDTCICICKGDPKKCQQEGLCRVIDTEHIRVLSSAILFAGAAIEEGAVHACIPLEKNLIPLTVSKERTGLLVTYSSIYHINNADEQGSYDSLKERLRICTPTTLP